MSESSSRGEEEPPEDGEERDLAFDWTEASDAVGSSMRARVGRKQQSTEHFPVAILVNQLSFSCFRLVRVTISVTKDHILAYCILMNTMISDLSFFFLFKQRSVVKSPFPLLQVLYRYILICHTLSTPTPTSENINEGEMHWFTLSS